MYYKLLFLVFICCNALITSAQNDPGLMADTLWTYPIKGYPVEVPLIDPSHIYLGADVSPVICIDKKTGSEKWRLNADVSGRGFVHTVKEDGEGTLYTNGISRTLFAIRKTDGKLIWRYPCKFDDDLFSVITIVKKVLYVNPAAPEFLALNTDGSLLWNAQLPDYCMSYTIHDDLIYCQFSNGTCIVNRKNGKIMKLIENTSANRSAYPPDCIGNKVVMQHHDSLICFDKNTFSPIWSLNGIRGFSSIAGQLYVFSDTAFKKIEFDTGELIWSYSGDFSWYLQPVIHKSSVYLQTRYRFIILDEITGELQYNSAFPYKSYTKPVIENDKLYIGIGGKYVCIKNPLSIKK